MSVDVDERHPSPPPCRGPDRGAAGRGRERLRACARPSLLAAARGETYVTSRAVAEEVVQEAWLGVLKGLDRFEGRSSLKTWILRIVANRARTRGERERRSVPFSSLARRRRRARRRSRPLPAADDPRYPGGWTRAAARAGPAAGGAADRRRDARSVRSGDRRAPGAPAGGHPPARRRGLGRRRGVRGARAERGQPARAAAPRALEGAGRARAPPQPARLARVEQLAAPRSTFGAT